MAIFKLLAKIFKKLGKLLSGRKGKDAVPSDRKPGERRVGIYGPSSVGKSVFFTMVYNACKTDSEFNLSPEDQATGRDLLNYLNTLRQGEWLSGTVDSSELNFRASIRGGANFPFSTKDYKGELVDLEHDSTARAELIAYFRDCDAILFMLAPEMIEDPHKCEREILSFQAMIAQVTDTGSGGLRIPIGLMITKADMIPGFENENQVRLIAPNAGYLKAKRLHDFVNGVCEQYHIKQNIVFQEQVRSLLEKMTIFFDYMLTLSMEFEVFFVSSVGHVREVAQEDGTRRLLPPENPTGVGLKRPFLWVVETIRQRERIARFNAVRRGVFNLSIVVLLIYSLAYGLHLLPDRRDFATMTEEGENPQVTAEELAAYPARGTLAFNSFFPLPGAGVQTIRSDARRLEATYASYQFLRNDFTEERSAADLARIRAEFESNEVGQHHPWFLHLSGPQQQSLLTAMADVIAAHNLDMVQQIRELYGQLRAGRLTASDESAAAVDSLRQRLVALPTNLPDYQNANQFYQALDREAQDIHEVFISRGQAAIYKQRWFELKQRLGDICVGAVDQPRIQAYLDELAELEAEMDSSEVVGISQEKRAVANLRDLMRRLLDGTASNLSDSDRRARLNYIIQNSADLPLLRNYARTIRGGLDAEYRANAERTLTERIAAKLAEPTGRWSVLDSNLEHDVRAVTWLSGARRAAWQTYLDNLESLRAVGVDLSLEVVELRDGCAISVFDPETNQFSLSQALRGGMLPIRWRVGQQLRLAVVETGAAEFPDRCPDEGIARSIRQFHEQAFDIAGDCPHANLRGEVKIRFRGLENIIDTQLITPLREAFPQ